MKTFTVLFSLLLSLSLYSQTNFPIAFPNESRINIRDLDLYTISISGNSTVEIGIKNTYTFQINGLNSVPDSASYYKVGWTLSSPFIVDNGVVKGYIGNKYNGSDTYQEFEPDFQRSNMQSFPIQWGGNFSQTSTTISASAKIYLYDNGDHLLKTINVPEKTMNPITVNIITTPLLSGVNSVLNCSQTNFTQKVIHMGAANNFTWSISGGSGDGKILSGQGTKSAIIKPPLDGSFQVTVIAKRIEANPKYLRKGKKTFARASRTISFSAVDGSNFLCKGYGKEFEIENDPYITNIKLTAQHSSVIYNGITGGKRVYTITPNSSVSNGSKVNISVTAQFRGGCSASFSKSVSVYKSEVPPTPNGYVSLIPISGNVCYPEGYRVKYSSSYTNGYTLVRPAIIPPHPPYNSTYTVAVTYSNACSNLTTVRYYTVSPPPLCKSAQKSESFSISPNPNNGRFKLIFNQQKKGNYYIYNFYGKLIFSDSFTNSKIVTVNPSNNLKRGIYFVVVKTKNSVIRKQFIIESKIY